MAHESLPMDVLRYRADREAEAAEENQLWLESHPEASHILNDFVCAALAEQPDDVFAFAREHFAPPRAGAPGAGAPSAEAAPGAPSAAAAAAFPQPVEEDGLVEHLRSIFVAAGTDSSGTAMRSVLAAQVAADSELLALMGREGLERLVAQLDADGAVSWDEFHEYARPPPPVEGEVPIGVAADTAAEPPAEVEPVEAPEEAP